MQTNESGSLQNKFQDFGAAPSEQLWDSIAANLDADKKRKGAFWWWFIGVAAIVVLLFGVYQLGYNAGTSEKKSIIVNEETPNPDNQIPTTNNQEISNQTNQQHENSSHQNLANQTAVQQNSETKNNSENNMSDNEKVEPTNNSDERPKLDIVERTNFEEPIIIVPINTSTIQQKFEYDDITQKLAISKISKINHTFPEPKLASEPTFISEPLVIIENPTPKNKWELGFNIGTLKGFQSSNQDMMADTNASLSTFDNLGAYNSIEGTGISSFSNLSESQVNITRPLQLEMTIARDLGKRWNFQTGLSFGFLFSNNQYYSGGITNVRSRFLSIGIPIHFNYDIIQRQWFSFYSGIGVNYEMPFFESVKTSYSVSALESTSTKDFTKGYMISGQLNAGFRYNLNPKLKLDFRPNLRYYIHQSMQSVYPALERKIWAGASLGLVWLL